VRVPLAASGLRPQDINKAIEVLNSGYLTMGKNVTEFEAAMANYLNVDSFVMMNSGSSANLAIFEALLRPTKGEPRLNAGDEVLVPAIAWPTTIWPIIQLGLRPKFIDVDPITLGIDFKQVKKLLEVSKGKIKAIFPIHPLGRALDNIEIEEICKTYNLINVTDICESLGSWINGKHAGTTSLAGSFSFYFSHHITTMEGGGVFTNDSNFADDLRSIRSHGWSRDRRDVAEWTANSSRTDAKFLFITSGFNTRPMEIQAAIGMSQIKDIDNFIKRRVEIAKYVNDAISNSEYEVIGSDAFSNSLEKPKHSWMFIPIKAVGKHAKENKLRMLQHFEDSEIETRPVLTGNFLDQPAMKRIYKDSPDPREFPIADEISNTTFLIGAHHDLTDSQVEFVGEKILEIVNAKK